jgi:predicted short-subunit dehydrogenase-like oxidoreductase (DUF2520 family)
VGRTLAAALAERGHAAEVVAARRKPPEKPWDAELVVLATRDSHLGDLAIALAGSGAVGRKTAVVHVAGALGPGVLAPLREVSAGIGQAHPLLSFASPDAPPSLEGAQLLVSGDPAAVRRAKALARILGMTPREWPGVDLTLYHATAALVANGAAALAHLGAAVLAAAGAPAHDVPSALSALLRSVAENVDGVGLPAALTGPVRRGDASTVGRHLDALAARAPDAFPLYLESARAQLAMARTLGDASDDALKAVAREISRRRTARREAR